jgi:hypothetical protein
VVRLLDDPELRSDLAQVAMERAEPMTWAKTAEQTLAVFLETAHK